MNSLLITVPSYAATFCITIHMLQLHPAYVFFIAWTAGQLVSMLALRYSK